MQCESSSRTPATETTQTIRAEVIARVPHLVQGVLLLGQGSIDRKWTRPAQQQRGGNSDREQVKFWVDYAGGWGKYGAGFHFAGGCKHYTGPPLPWLVVACDAPDGSFWALQAWQRELPDYGVQPTLDQRAWELHLSHWSGALPASVFYNKHGKQVNHVLGAGSRETYENAIRQLLAEDSASR